MKDNNQLFWPLVYADNSLAYIRENHPAIYEECGDDKQMQDQRQTLLSIVGEPTIISDRDRLQAIWDGASDENSVINKFMSEAPEPKTLKEFLASIDQAILQSKKENLIVETSYEHPSKTD